MHLHACYPLAFSTVCRREGGGSWMKPIILLKFDHKPRVRNLNFWPDQGDYCGRVGMTAG